MIFSTYKQLEQAFNRNTVGYPLYFERPQTELANLETFLRKGFHTRVDGSHLIVRISNQAEAEEYLKFEYSIAYAEALREAKFLLSLDRRRKISNFKNILFRRPLKNSELLTNKKAELVAYLLR